MSVPLPAVPPPSVAYQYDPTGHALRVTGSAPEFFAAVEHLQARAPRELPVAGRFTVLAVGGVTLAVAIALRVVAGAGAESLDPGAAVGLAVGGGMLTLLGLVVSVVGLVRSTKTVRTVLDAAVTQNVTLLPEAAQLLRALAPGTYELTLRLPKTWVDDGSGRSAYTTAVHGVDFGITLRSAAGWGASAVSTGYSESSTQYTRRERITRSRSWRTHEYTATPARLPDDIAARVGAAGAHSFPQVPDAAVTELVVREGGVRLSVRSRDKLGAAHHAAYANAVARLAGLPGPVFAG